MKTVQTLDYSEAKKINDLIVDKALQMQKAAVIAVADSHGELIAFARMDGASLINHDSETAAAEFRRRHSTKPSKSGSIRIAANRPGPRRESASPPRRLEIR
jgi:uncharacterized protein GlcG (DUF336 family)